RGASRPRKSGARTTRLESPGLALRGSTAPGCRAAGSVPAARLLRARLRRSLRRRRRAASGGFGVGRPKVRLCVLRVEAGELVLVVGEQRRRGGDAERLRLGE